MVRPFMFGKNCITTVAIAVRKYFVLSFKVLDCFRIYGIWTGVATWKWIANDDNCGICRMAFDGCCPDCKLPGDDCPLVWGQCSHVFHMHCIVKWLQSQSTNSPCPMCRQEWKWKA
ncbi:hypothetical protein EGW08_010699, partial [Elysia chlorotica]